MTCQLQTLPPDSFMQAESDRMRENATHAIELAAARSDTMHASRQALQARRGLAKAVATAAQQGSVMRHTVANIMAMARRQVGVANNC